VFIIKPAFSSCISGSTCARSFTKSTCSNIYLVNIKCLFLFVPDLYSWFHIITWVSTWKFSFRSTYQSQTVRTNSCPKTLIRNYHYSLHNNREKHSSHLLMFLIMRKYLFRRFCLFSPSFELCHKFTISSNILYVTVLPTILDDAILVSFCP